jgi:hypothetical protein
LNKTYTFISFLHYQPGAYIVNTASKEEGTWQNKKKPLKVSKPFGMTSS